MNNVPDEIELDDSECKKPCDPDSGCPECVDYWNRMEQEGFWDAKNHRWTERGWREMMKEAIKDLKKNNEVTEGLKGTPQETMPPDEVKNAETAISDFLTKNPSGYTISYGADSGKDTAYIAFNKANDYSGKSGQIVYQTLYKFKKDLYDIAKRLWQQKQEEEYYKAFPPVELNRDDVLKQLDASSKHMDWYYEQSDDHGVWSFGHAKMLVIKKLLEKASLIDPDGAKEVIKKNFPRDFQGWASSFVDSINNKRNNYRRMYKL